MNYAVELGPDTMIYIPSVIKIGSGHTYRQQSDPISLLLYFQNKESRVQIL
jgi:hypothetical protein